MAPGITAETFAKEPESQMKQTINSIYKFVLYGYKFNIVVNSVLHFVLHGGHVDIGLQTRRAVDHNHHHHIQRAWIPDQTNNQMFIRTWL